ncbi:MAG: PilX N-terminal domain-containing pilus assembly protein [Methylococcaceae bacterium]|nr:PilX N-terminal domain-containing pilus assembly protein [Methylococcaceae bacterium]
MKYSINSNYQQSGAVLVISLIMLLLLTLIGVTGTQVSSMEEKMAGNFKDQNMAFQAAESGLRAGETWVAVQGIRPVPNNTGSTQVWTLDSAATATTNNWWEERNATWWSSNAVQFAATLSDVKTKPYYLIEQQYFDKDSLTIGMSNDNSGRVLYRVTAKGTGGSDSTRALLQSTYSKRF